MEIPRIKVYWKPDCKWCDKAKEHLYTKGMEFEAIQLGEDISIEYFKMINPQAKTAPAIFVDEIFIGGYTELKEMYP